MTGNELFQVVMLDGEYYLMQHMESDGCMEDYKNTQGGRERSHQQSPTFIYNTDWLHLYTYFDGPA